MRLKARPRSFTGGGQGLGEGMRCACERRSNIAVVDRNPETTPASSSV